MIVLFIIFLVGFCLLMSVREAHLRLKRAYLDKKLSFSKRYKFFHWLSSLFPNERTHPLDDFLNLSSLVAIVGYAFSWTFLSIKVPIILVLAIFLVCHLTFYLLASKFPLIILKLFSLPASLYIILFFWIVWPIVFIEKKWSKDTHSLEPKLSSEKLKRRLLELLNDYELQQILDPRDKKLVKSIAHFGDLVAREIMVPRVDILGAPETISLYDSLRIFVDEGYSRIPIYRESIDHITGVLLYKDVMEVCLPLIDEKKIDSIYSTSIKPLVSPIIYTPENKKIQDLFQEMRIQKIHSAIIVNEYGCTEGLLTIEDILEELVGSEIFDEHDEEETESRYKETDDKSWIVDAKMSIIDIERKLGIQIPHRAEYETIAGYISSQMGMIPPSGTVIYADQCKIQILASDKRQIIKVKITPQETEK